jgi:hypothetical protein
MKNLLERLKPEHKAKLDIESEKYPFSTSLLLKNLKTQSFYVDLRYGDVATLINVLDLKEYNPLTISELFES